MYIGASVLPLLVDAADRFAASRGTKDVDAVAGTASYTARGRLEEALRARGFLHHMGSHAGRWISPHGEIFDLSFAGDHLGGTGASRLLLAVPELAPALRSHFRDRQPILPDTPDSLAVETVEVLERLCELA